MNTLGEIMAATAQLSVPELRELRRETERLEMIARAIPWRVGDRHYRLVRLNDSEFGALLRRSLPIEENHGPDLQFYLAMRALQNQLNLAEAYLVLKDWTGESGRLFDDWKGSFTFPFALDVIKSDQSFPYMLEVCDCRGSLEFRIWKVVAADDDRIREGLIRPPFSGEFPREEIDKFIPHFFSYLVDCWEAIRSCPHKPFVRKVDSSDVLYGYVNGATLAEQYCSSEAYEAAYKHYQDQVRA
jgi:hypothetical protein